MDENERQQLFNGVDLSGWQMVGPGHFVVEDGMLVSRGGMGLLYFTGQPFGDCLLRVVYRTGRDEDNSGVFIRIDGPPADPWHAVHHGYEVQIFKPGDDYHSTGTLYSLSKALARPDAPPGEWNTMDIALDGELVRVTLNGELVTDFDSTAPVPDRIESYEPERGPRPTHGFIGLQNHDEPSRVEFREVSFGPLPESKGTQ